MICAFEQPAEASAHASVRNRFCAEKVCTSTRTLLITHLRVDLGEPRDDLLTLAMMSDATVEMGGGWWLLGAGQRVEQSLLAANGSTVQPPRVVVPAGQHARQVRYAASAAMGQSVVLRKLSGVDGARTGE